jgi:multidrug efflux pump subunit AcrA (membrane-fusion protein)
MAAAAEARGNDRGAVIWTLDHDRAAVPVRVALGRSNDSATEVVESPLRAGQQVIIGMTSPPQERSWFGISWRQ